MHFIIQLIFVAAAWRWGDWKNWKAYYPTILFLIIGDLLNNFINYNRPLWTFVPGAIEKSFYSNHTIITLGELFLGFPALALIYLGHFPKGRAKQILYVAGWVAFQSILEAVSHYLTGGIAYSNGWNYLYSVAFSIYFFVILRIHYLKPLLAWAIAAVVVIVRLVMVLPQLR